MRAPARVRVRVRALASRGACVCVRARAWVRLGVCVRARCVRVWAREGGFVTDCDTVIPRVFSDLLTPRRTSWHDVSIGIEAA